MRRSVVSSSVVVVITISGAPAYASLIGDTVNVYVGWIYDDFCLDSFETDTSVEVTGGVELSEDGSFVSFGGIPADAHWEVNIGDSFIDVALCNDGGDVLDLIFPLFMFSSLGWVDHPDGYITDVVIADLYYFLLGAVGEHHFSVYSTLGVSVDPGQMVTTHMDIITKHPSGDVPGPAMIALLASGIGTLVFKRRNT